MTYVRYHELLNAIRNRVNSDKMKRILGGNTRVYLGYEDFSDPEDSEDLPWGRLVIQPTSTLWPETAAPGYFWKFGLLFRAEFNNFQRTGYSTHVSLEAALAEVQERMFQWVPAPMVYIQVGFPFFMHQPPQPAPMWDDRRNVYMLSSTYRTEVCKP